MSNLFPTYARWEVEPDYAKGTLLTDKYGKSYLDFTSGIGVCNLGHQPDNVKKAVEKQLEKFWHVSNLFVQTEQEKAAQMLAKEAEMKAVFFANSGAEANEAAIKLARKATGKTKIITFQQSFHGRTFATMSATGQEKIKQGFGPMLETFIYVPFNDIDALQDAISDDVAAVMLEIVQGEGGIHVGTEAFLKEVENLCEKHKALLIIDEIQTGIGRTGKPFAFQHFQLTPDIVTLAKGLGSGLPIGAMIGKEELKQYFGPGSHGSTFGGNPLSISAAIATLETIFQEEFLKEVQSKSKMILRELEKLVEKGSIIKEVRGLGLMIGIELVVPIQPILVELRNQGLIALPAGEYVLRLLPPLTISEIEIKEGMNIILSELNKHVQTAK